MNRDQVSEIFYQCIERMEQGESIQSCLSSYPDHLEYLAPLLEAAAKSLELNPASSTPLVARQSGSERIEAAIQFLREEDQEESDFSGNNSYSRRTRRTDSDPIRSVALPESGWTSLGENMRLVVRSAVLVVLVTLLTSLFTVTTSAHDSLPGDPLYSLKRQFEDVRLALAVGERARAGLQEQFQERRLTEIESLLNQGLAARVHFEGELGEKTQEIWTISGLPVTIQSSTELNGALNDGEIVRVEAVTSEDGRVVAEEISATAVVDPAPENPEQPSAASPGDHDLEDGDQEEWENEDEEAKEDKDKEDKEKKEDQDKEDQDKEDKDKQDKDKEDQDKEDQEGRPDLPEQAEEHVPDIVEEKVPDAVQEEVPGQGKGQGKGQSQGKGPDK